MPEGSPSLSEFGGVSERSPLVVQAHSHPQASPSPPPILHDLQQSDSTSYVLLNLAKGKEITICQHIHTHSEFDSFIYQAPNCNMNNSDKIWMLTSLCFKSRSAPGYTHIAEKKWSNTFSWSEIFWLEEIILGRNILLVYEALAGEKKQ